MIPTMILIGLVLGRWWKTAIVLGAAVWPVILFLDGVLTTLVQVIPAAAFGAANTAVGVAVHQVGLLLVRAVRSTPDH